MRAADDVTTKKKKKPKQNHGGVHLGQLARLIERVRSNLSSSSSSSTIVVFPRSSHSRMLVHSLCARLHVKAETQRSKPFAMVAKCGYGPGAPPRCSESRCCGNSFESCFGGAWVQFCLPMVLTVSWDETLAQHFANKKEKQNPVLLGDPAPSNMWSRLPIPCLLQICLHLKLDSIKAVILVCKPWSRVDCPLLWNKLFWEMMEEEQEEAKVEDNKSWKELCRQLVMSWKSFLPLCKCTPFLKHRHELVFDENPSRIYAIRCVGGPQHRFVNWEQELAEYKRSLL